MIQEQKELGAGRLTEHRSRAASEAPGRAWALRLGKGPQGLWEGLHRGGKA